MFETNRKAQRSLQGLILALGAPLGWLLIRTLEGMSPLALLSAQPGLFIYMLTGTGLAFGIFGWLLGRHEEKLEEISITDGLTGLRNQRYFRMRFEEEFESARRHARPLSLLMMDLDFFKKVNDLHGHPLGDRLLAEVARAFAGQVRKGETLARVGGEEFALLLPGIAEPEALLVGERIRQAVKKIELPGRQGGVVGITVSLGLASVRNPEKENMDLLYSRADQALYQAKEQGRDRLVAAI